MSCVNKRAYGPSEVTGQLKRKQRMERQRLYAYVCPECQCFHLTKLKPPTERIVTLISMTTRTKP
jgi:hypothetical protein